MRRMPLPEEQAKYEERADAYYAAKRRAALEGYVVIRWEVPMRPWLSHARRQTVLSRAGKEKTWLIARRREAEGTVRELASLFPEGHFMIEELPGRTAS